MNQVAHLFHPEPHVCAWEDQGTDHPGSNFKAHALKILRQLASFQQWQIVPEQFGGLL